MPTDAVFEFLDRHSSFIVTTHDPADADGLGAEIAFSFIAKSMGKQIRLVNSGPTLGKFQFIDPDNTIETWKDIKGTLDRNAALVILDTTDEYFIGELRDIIPYVPEVFVIDHHEPNKFCTLKGYIDNTASSTCEMIVELAHAAGIALPPPCAKAAYTGLVYDTGSFAYAKTTDRTFKTALSLVDAGVTPYDIYRRLNESDSIAALLLQKKVLSSLEIHNEGRVAVQMVLKSDLEATGAFFEDSEHFINIPLKSKDILVSVLMKENREGHIRCSLRSKGTVNVSKIAQAMGGGGHVSSAGFRSPLSLGETLAAVLAKVAEELGKADGQLRHTEKGGSPHNEWYF
ncbi:MAG: bifunctional oligoribonuclease/PAP phosphatase NrnA [Treponema sp.]|nr:bifunctional oligoribonuclease/PAP phosphatase NrnA [Treponema sp.]